MSDRLTNDDMQIVVAFTSSGGFQDVSVVSDTLEDLQEKSAQAIEKAMDTIQMMGKRLANKLKSMGPDKPDEVEVEFGIQFDVEAGAVVSKVGGQSSIKVTMTWKDE
ncbi:MAG: hypothetical protein JXJ17_11980 [Anaerolineae bacterium]|nr:hypothetical protein [Anaerolineae bacterium]